MFYLERGNHGVELDGGSVAMASIPRYIAMKKVDRFDESSPGMLYRVFHGSVDSYRV